MKTIALAIWLWYNLAALILYLLFLQFRKTRGLIERHNKELEHRVQIRTQELEQAKALLVNMNEELEQKVAQRTKEL